MKPTFFSKPAEFRKWLAKNHHDKTELIVGYYKVHTKKPSMTWSQSVDEALCFGWIDGIRRSIDDQSYTIRFTPRKKNSIWSAVNIKKMEVLKKKGLLKPAGIDIFENRTDDKSSVYAFEQKDMKLPVEYENQLKANQKAWEYFQALAPSYKKNSIYYITSAKQEKTKLKRLEELISDSALGTNKWKHNKYNKKK